MHSQLNDYLDKRGILCENQSGFGGGFSTDSCLIGLSDYVKGEIGKGNLVGMVLIDLQYGSQHLAPGGLDLSISDACDGFSLSFWH